MSENSILESRIGNMSEALEALGVTETTLSTAERASIENDGFVVLRDMIDPEWLAGLRNVYEQLMTEKYGKWHSGQVGNKDTDFWNHEAGTRRLSDLVSESELFDRIYTHPRLLAAVAVVLGNNFWFNSLNARDALPGQGQQALHVDGPALKPGERSEVVNSAWLLDDFTVENGATRVVPGTHKLTGAITDHGIDPNVIHPRQQLVLAPAGSVFVFNSYVWHSGTQNRTSQPRRVIHCAFSSGDHKQRDSQKKRIRKSTYERISPAAKFVLDV